MASPQTLVQRESAWREAPLPLRLTDGRPGRLMLSQWVGRTQHKPVEAFSDLVDESHVMTIVLRSTRVSVALAKRRLAAGRVKAGTLFLNGPRSCAWHAIFYADYDHLRAHIPQSTLAECYESAFGRPPSSQIALMDTAFSDDPILRNLARVLGNSQPYDDIVGPCFMDALGLALAARLMSLATGARHQPGSSSRPLTKWRLDRVIDYIDAHLPEQIYLEELSEVAGLSRMQFSASFRAATGHPPHKFILNRKVERAQQLLLDSDRTIVSVALGMGFSSQAHFTEAFRRVVGETPASWRQRVSTGN